MKKIFLIVLLLALAFVAGYQLGYTVAPRNEPVQLVLPPQWVPDKTKPDNLRA